MGVFRNMVPLARLAAGLLLAGSAAHAVDCSKTQSGKVPLDDLGPATYLGYQGGLYPGGSNLRPLTHDRAYDRTSRLVLLDANGTPDAADGSFVFISIGNSNTTQEFRFFAADEEKDPEVNSRLVFVDCAVAGQSIDIISDPAAEYWTDVDEALADGGVTGLQVQSVWLKEALPDPVDTWPSHAIAYQTDLGEVVRILKSRFPNLKSVYHTSRIYGGYGPHGVNPEPYSYWYGFSVKWLLEDQLRGAPELNFDPAKGPVVAPWMAWGPYLWADGLNARSDGLRWECRDFDRDGIHPSPIGKAKVSERLQTFFKTDPTTVPWFRDCDLSASDTFASPPEVLSGRMGKDGANRYRLDWSSLDPVVGSDAVYDVVSGRLSELRADRGFARAECLASDLGDTPMTQTGRMPPAGDGDYYLVRGRNSCGTGTFGDGSQAPDPRDALDAGSPSCP